MKADLPINHVLDISVAVVIENDDLTQPEWHVYLINEKPTTIQNVLITSKGYGEKDGVEVKTSVLRHFIGDVDSMDYARIEAIDPQVFGLNNEYWLSFYVDGTIYDKKYIFVPDSIVEDHLIHVPVLNKKGIVIGGMIEHEDTKSN
jgi:hypothetical protein